MIIEVRIRILSKSVSEAHDGFNVSAKPAETTPKP